MGDAGPAVPDRVKRARGAGRTPKRPATALVAATAALCVVAAACGGGSDGGATLQTTSIEAAPAGGALDDRVAAGIAAADGDTQALGGGNPCNQPDPAGDGPLTVAYVGGRLDELESIGLEATVVEDPSLIIEAYVNQVNFSGGIDGRCVELQTYLWSLTDAAASFAHICTDLPPRQPVLLFSLTLPEPTLRCLTLDSQITTLALYTAVPEATLTRSGFRLFVDDGLFEHLMLDSLRDAASSGVVDQSDSVGFLQGTGVTSATSAEGRAEREERVGRLIAAPAANIMFIEERIRRLGVNVADSAGVPPEYGDLGLLLAEKQVRLLETGLSEDELQEAQQIRASLPPELAALYMEIEEFYISVATRFRDAGVTVVASTASWTDLRRMMRAAERIDWTPTWVANDVQPATVLLADAPRRQTENLVQVSARRAAGDEIPELDRGCITLRNTAVEAPPFAHRPHSDAWNLITSICDYLDVSFGAITRANEPITTDSVRSALNDTHYDAPYGGLITFSPSRQAGAERFRVLKPDVDCVLNFWGCMRSTTGWLTPPAR